MPLKYLVKCLHYPIKYLMIINHSDNLELYIIFTQLHTKP